MRNLSLMIIAALMAACSYIPFSGGALSGTLTAPPNDWTQVASPSVVELETQPSDPYSVKLWIIGLGPNLWVHAGANRATWVEHMEVDPNVRVLIGDALYELAAERVTGAEEFGRFADAYEEKYGNRPRNENIAEIYLYRLVPRA